MRHVLIISLAVFLTIVIGGGSILWMVQAAHTKALVEDAINRFNAGPAKITYDAIETWGFPLEMHVSIVRPRLTGRIDRLFPHPAAGADSEWDEDLQLDGNITFGVNAFSDHYMVAANGAWKNRSVFRDGTIAMEGTAGGGDLFFCNLHMKRGLRWLSTSLWDIEGFKKYGEDFFNDLRLIDCMKPEQSVSDQASGAVLMRGSQRFYLRHDPDGDAHDLRFLFKADNVEVPPEGSKVFAAYARGLPFAYPFSSRLAAYGKQNAEIDVSYRGPLDWQGGLRLAPMAVHVNKFSVSNLAYTASLDFDLKSETHDREHTFALNFKGEAAYNDIYNVLLKESLYGFVEDAYRNRAAAPPTLKPLIGRHTQQEAYTLLAAALPDLHSLGKMTMAANLNYEGDREFTAGSLTLHSLELSAAPYGITGSGALKPAPGRMFPEGSAVFTCANCPKLADDIFDYAARARKALAASDPASSAFDPQRAEKMKHFLRALAMTPAGNGNDFVYRIVNDDAGVFINGKPMAEVIAMYQDAMAPPPGAKPAQ